MALYKLLSSNILSNISFQSAKEKYKRRQTWAPGAGGMSGLLKKELRTIDEREEVSPFSMHTKRSLPILRESISPMNLAHLKQTSLVTEGKI